MAAARAQNPSVQVTQDYIEGPKLKPPEAIGTLLGLHPLAKVTRSKQQASNMVHNSLKVLAMALMTLKPASSFNPSGAPFVMSHPTHVALSPVILNKARCIGHCVTVMNDNSKAATPAKLREKGSIEVRLDSLTVKELKEKLKSLRLKSSGPKADLIARLEAHTAEQQPARTEQEVHLNGDVSGALNSSAISQAIAKLKKKGTNTSHNQLAERAARLQEPSTHEEERNIAQGARYEAEQNSTSEDRPSAMAERWYVDVPSTFDEMARQASRAVIGALPHTGRLIIEAAAPELDPASKNYRPEDLMLFVALIGQAIANQSLLPPSRPDVKLLFSKESSILAGAFVMDPRMPVQAFGFPSAIGETDGAFVIVSPSLGPAFGINCEAALNALMQEAGRRPIVLINPRLGNSPVISTFTQAYLMRPLSLTFLRNQSSQQAERVTACVLHCYPHEYSILYNKAEFIARFGTKEKRWRYAGRFDAVPRPEQIEEVLGMDLMKLREEARVRAQRGNDHDPMKVMESR